MAVTINADNGVSSGSAGLKQSADSTGVLALQTNGTTAVSISTGQVVTLTNALPVASGGTGATTNAGAAFALKGANSDITSISGLTTPLSAAQGGTGLTSAGANGNVLTSNGTTWTSAAASGFPAGTLMLFQQTTAPTGWTKQTTHNDKTLRVVSGAASSGGTSAFTTVFTNQTPTITTSGLSVDATTLSTAQIPSHAHNIGASIQASGPATRIRGTDSSSVTNNISTDAQGGGGSHTHTISGSATSSAITLNVQYVDLIIASKN